MEGSLECADECRSMIMTEFLPQHSNHLHEFCDSVSKHFGLNFVCMVYHSYLKRGISSFSGRHMMALF